MTHDIELRSVTQRFRSVVAVDDVSLTLEGGRIHGLLGRNGSGKTTLLSIAAAYRKPTSGQALVGGSVAPNPDEYLFWDEVHPTHVGHQRLGRMTVELLHTRRRHHLGEEVGLALRTRRHEPLEFRYVRLRSSPSLRRRLRQDGGPCGREYLGISLLELREQGV
jgi:ABC-type branched-subunit amino acid transport system ATPase component